MEKRLNVFFLYFRFIVFSINVQSIISDHFQKISNKICTENMEMAGQKD